jgi:hypothetical protein
LHPALELHQLSFRERKVVPSYPLSNCSSGDVQFRLNVNYCVYQYYTLGGGTRPLTAEHRFNLR